MRYTVGVVAALILAPVWRGSNRSDANPPPANNGGSAVGPCSWISSPRGQPAVTELVTASTAAANANFNVEIFTYVGSGLGGPVGQGPAARLRLDLLGTAVATQGASGSSGVSLR